MIDPEEITGLITWWKDHEKEYPILAQMAFDILTIPGMSAEVERAFSQAGRLITDDRNRLGAPTVIACELQKNWLIKGHIQGISLPSI